MLRKMDLSALDLDIIHSILALVCSDDALRFAMTCRAAYTVAMPYFLADITLGEGWSNRGPEHIDRFCAMVQSNPTYFLPKLRRLTLGSTAFDHRKRGVTGVTHHKGLTSALLLAKVLVQATGLSTFCLHRAESTLELPSALGDALASLPNLLDIRLYGAGPRSLALLSRISSRLRYVELEMTTKLDFVRLEPISVLVKGRDRFLANLSSSLEVLKIMQDPRCVQELEPDTVWPNVNRLDLGGGTITLAEYARAFPSLRILHLASITCDDGIEPARWAGLDVLTTKSPLPIAGPVRRIELAYDLDVVEDAVTWTPGTTALLQQTSPVVLACCPTLQMLQCIARSVHSLRFLQIFMHKPIFPSATDAEDLDTWVSTRIPLLASVPLVGLTLARNGDFVTDANEPSRIASAIASHIPSLVFVGLNTTTSPPTRWSDYLFTWYRVVSRLQGEAPVLTLLSQSHADTVMRDLLSTPR
ncbi:hypothetical protein WOLCODRAFT_168050 [Wolfiporia cocos MD-104 SS10]|uniref:F-box domain-containing protein n=1 Tax=Wolfiporia cocos (strain MD-104) TaxID=742152 RepID=A0A2H3JPG7_WOLCO|nr:hypothetical protein WOLCODRAFT_168050 [Wolfiporia cocos MD-104 SS10]